MESLRRSLLVLCVAVTITMTSTLSVQQKKKLYDEVARSLLQDTYNQKSHDNFLYKILEIKHVFYENERKFLHFTIQETRCLKLENLIPDRCEFKDNGLVRDCLGQIFSAGYHRFVVLSCNPVAIQQGQAQEELDADASPALLRGHPGRRRGRRDIEEESLASGRGESRPYLSQDGSFFQSRTFFSFKPQSFPHAKPADLLPARRFSRSYLPPPLFGRPGFPRPRPIPNPRPRPRPRS